MRSGRLTETIQIHRGAWIDDGRGTLVPGPLNVIAIARAQVIEESTDEFIRAHGASTERLRIFRTRHIDDLTLGDTVHHADVEFNILQIKPIGRRRGLELRCTAVGS